MKKQLKRASIVASTLLLLTSQAFGATVDFSTGGSFSGSGFTNVFTKSGDDGNQVTVEGHSLVGNTEPFTRAQVQQFASGLGSCNTGEGLGCPVGPHSTDNLLSDDFLLVEFTDSVLLESASFTAWKPDGTAGLADSDVSYWAGLGDPNPLSLATLGAETINTTNTLLAQGTTRTISLNTVGPVDWLLIGALRGGEDDGIKLSSIEYTAVPVPPVAILFGTGLAGLVGLARRHGFMKKS